jgi:hypothetical protein
MREGCRSYLRGALHLSLSDHRNAISGQRRIVGAAALTEYLAVRVGEKRFRRRTSVTEFASIGQLFPARFGITALISCTSPVQRGDCFYAHRTITDPFLGTRDRFRGRLMMQTWIDRFGGPMAPWPPSLGDGHRRVLASVQYRPSKIPP